MPTCDNCGEYVTHNFVRVFGVDGAIRGCPGCMRYSKLYDSEAVVSAGETL